jgi:hypothetical protein
MDQLTQNEQISMLGAFAMAVREGRFLWDCHEVLVEGTVRGAISHVVQTFRAAGRQNPTKTMTENLASFYQDSIKCTRTKILNKNNKRP